MIKQHRGTREWIAACHVRRRGLFTTDEAPYKTFRLTLYQISMRTAFCLIRGRLRQAWCTSPEFQNRPQSAAGQPPTSCGQGRAGQSALREILGIFLFVACRKQPALRAEGRGAVRTSVRGGA
jgi:hypothetical protein